MKYRIKDRCGDGDGEKVEASNDKDKSTVEEKSTSINTASTSIDTIDTIDTIGEISTNIYTFQNGLLLPLHSHLLGIASVMKPNLLLTKSKTCSQVKTLEQEITEK